MDKKEKKKITNTERKHYEEELNLLRTQVKIFRGKAEKEKLKAEKEISKLKKIISMLAFSD